jgi:hypothetical protein
VGFDLHALASLVRQWLVAATAAMPGPADAGRPAALGLLAHQVAAGRANPPGGQAAQAIGRTKGGLNTKPAAVVDRHGRAVAVWLAPGPQPDLHAVEPLRPTVRQQRLVADKGFDADSFRARLRHQHTQCCIPP